MKIGNITHNGNKIPQLEIQGVLKEKEHTFYLSPFRGYRFQVSEDAYGKNDCGSSSVFELKRIVEKQDEELTREMFYLMAMAALNQHAKLYTTDHCWHESIQDTRQIEEFITLAIKWIKTIK